MLSLIKKCIPLSIKNILIRMKRLKQLKNNYKEDMNQFIKYSFQFGKEKTKRHYEAELIFFYHKIEKGLSLPSPRVGFGKKSVKYLLTILEDYIKNFGWDEESL